MPTEEEGNGSGFLMLGQWLVLDDPQEGRGGDAGSFSPTRKENRKEESSLQKESFLQSFHVL